MVLLYVLPPRFLLRVPALASQSESLWCESVSQVSPFLLQYVLVSVIATETPKGTSCNCGHDF